MLGRKIRNLVQQRLRAFPAVALLGARQVGKTTLARGLSDLYFDLEQPTDRLRLDLEWEEVVQGKALAVLDEAQAWPEVFPRLRGAIDLKRRRNGRFLLLGSVSPALMREVAQSLAGRLTLTELSPILASELPADQVDRLWLQGGYPDGGVLGGSGFPVWQKDYLTLLAQRDLPAWGLPAKPSTTQRLFRMLAALHGNVLNASHLGRSLGISYHTVSSYLEYLENAYLVRQLRPLHRNIRKRLVKSAKVYWRDSGLLHALLGARSMKNLLGQPWVGASWEGWVIEQTLSHLDALGVEHEAFFLRTSDGYEVDLFIELRDQRWAIEVKLTTAPTQENFARLEKAASWVGAHRTIIVSRTKSPAGTDARISTNLRGLLSLLDGL